MDKELYRIKNNIINKVVIISAIFISPSFIASVLRTLEIGWQNLYYLHTIMTVISIWLLFFKKKLNLNTKIHFVAVIYLLVGIAGLYAFGFTGGFYLCLIPIILSGILLKKNVAIRYFSVVAVFYVLIAIGFVKDVISVSVDLNLYQIFPTTWIVHLFGFILIA